LVKNQVSHKRKHSLATILAALACAAAATQERGELGVPPVRSYPLKAFGGNSQVWTIVRDQRGLLYVGSSQSDIHQYDGATWRSIPGPGSSIRSLALDREGTVWVGSSADFGRLQPDARGAMQYVSFLDKVPPEHRAFVDTWVRTTSRGVFFRSFTHLFRWDGSRIHVWKATGTFEGISEVNGRIYISQAGIGLQELVGDELRPAPGGDPLRKSTRVQMHAWDERRMLITARAETLSLYDGQTVSPFRTGADDYLKRNQAYYSIPLADGGYCITTLLGGAVILEHDGRLRRIIGQESGLPELGTYSAFQDAEGSLWLGHGATLSSVKLDSPVLVLGRTPTSEVARFNGMIYGSNATFGTALYRFIPDSKTGVPVARPIPTAFSQMFALRRFHDPSSGRDQLLGGIGSSGGYGIVKIEGDTVLPVLPSGYSGATYAIYQSRKYPNRVYAARSLGTAASMRWEGGKWIDEGSAGLTYNGRSLAEEADGTLWVGCDRAVVRFENPVSGLKAARPEVFSEKDGVLRGSNAVNWIDGQIFISSTSTQQGFIARWDAAARKFVRDDRFFLPLPAPRFAVSLWVHPNGDVWSETSAGTAVRRGISGAPPPAATGWMRSRSRSSGQYKSSDVLSKKMAPSCSAAAMVCSASTPAPQRLPVQRSSP
jgi:hypothetical protein